MAFFDGTALTYRQRSAPIGVHIIDLPVGAGGFGVAPRGVGCACRNWAGGDDDRFGASTAHDDLPFRTGLRRFCGACRNLGRKRAAISNPSVCHF